MSYYLNTCWSFITFSWKVATTTPVLLGTRNAQWIIFGVNLAQIITTILTCFAFINVLNFGYVWWPLMDVFRLIGVTMIRLDRLFPNTPRFIDTNIVYRIIAFSNVLSIIWGFIFWPIYCYYLPDGTDATIILVIMTITYMLAHAICSIPAGYKIMALSRQSESIYSPDNTFMAEFINNDSLQIITNNNNSKDMDDPILYSAPIVNEIKSDDNTPRNGTDLPDNKHNPLKIPIQHYSDSESELNSENEILQSMPNSDINNLENELLRESTIGITFNLGNNNILSNIYTSSDNIKSLYNFIAESTSKPFELKVQNNSSINLSIIKNDLIFNTLTNDSIIDVILQE